MATLWRGFDRLRKRMVSLESVPHSLIFKITLPTIALVLILSGTSALVIGNAISDVHLRVAERRSARVTRLVEDALQRDLDPAGPGHAGLTPFLKTLCGSSEKVAFVMARDGRVRFSSDSALCGTPVETRTAQGLVLDRGGVRWIRTLRPILGGAVCTSCHGVTRPIGYVGTDFPLDEGDAETRDQQRMNLTAGAMTALALSVLLVLVQYLLVYRPVRRLTAAVERIRGGDLSARVPAGGDDEIGQLGHSLNEMAASLERAKVELARTHRTELAQSEKLASLGQLFSTIAHEIKNQLAGIIGALKVVEAEAPESDTNKPVLGKVLSQMERMSKTAVTALEYARPLEPAVESVGAADLLDRTLFFIERQATEQGVELRKRYAPGLPRVRIDEELMKQVFLNLLLNGIQAMPGGGALEVEIKPSGPRTIEVTISDQGVGIPAENLDRIFSPFFSTKPRGTGLGLYIARQIVETQQGQIRVESRPGRGTSFTVRLPAEAVVQEVRTVVAC